MSEGGREREGSFNGANLHEKKIVMNTACRDNSSSGREHHKLFQTTISDTKKSKNKWKIMCALNSALVFFFFFWLLTSGGDDDDTK